MESSIIDGNLSKLFKESFHQTIIKIKKLINYYQIALTKIFL